MIHTCKTKPQMILLKEIKLLISTLYQIRITKQGICRLKQNLIILYSFQNIENWNYGSNWVILTNNKNNKYMKEVHFINKTNTKVLTGWQAHVYDFLIFYHKNSAPISAITDFALFTDCSVCVYKQRLWNYSSM